MAEGETSWKVIVAVAVGFTLATAGVSLRLLSRWFCRKRLQANDYLILVAYVLKLGIDIVSILLINYGMGRNANLLSVSAGVSYLKLIYVNPLFYAGSISFTKLSILALYWTAFSAKYIRYSVYVLGTYTALWGLSVILVEVLQCHPLHKAWNPAIEGHCLDYAAYYWGLEVSNIVSDFAILLLPLKAVWDLRLPLRQTLQLCGVLMVGALTVAIDIVRLVVLVRLDNFGNFTMHQVGMTVWTDLEPSIAILVACLPIMRPLLRPRAFLKQRNDPAYVGYASDTSDMDAQPKGKDIYLNAYAANDSGESTDS